MDILVRAAEYSDAAAIARVQVESWQSTYSGIVPDAFLASLNTETQTKRWQQNFIDGDGLIFVAEDETGIFGFVSGGPVREAVHNYDAELYAIYLFSPRQKQGIGRRLSRTLASALYRQGFQSMLVWVLQQNPSASFYSHLGAVYVSRKSIDLGGVSLPELAFGWPSLDQLLLND
jgi:GNAT superfamily N-acetyltransferase